MPAASWLMNLGFAGSAVAVEAPTITTTSLPGATVGEAYSETLQATGGAEPLTWSITSGQLPRGLTLDSDTGVISGTPSRQETRTFTVQVTDSGSQSDTQELTIAVAIGALWGPWRPVQRRAAISARASDIVQAHERAVASIKPFPKELPLGHVRDAVELQATGTVRMALIPYEEVSNWLAVLDLTKAKMRLMPDTEVDDLNALAAAGVIPMEVAQMMINEYILERLRSLEER